MGKREGGLNEKQRENEIRGIETTREEWEEERLRLRESTREREWAEMVWKNSHDMKLKTIIFVQDKREEEWRGKE